MQKRSKNEVAQKISKILIHRKSPPAGGGALEEAHTLQAASGRGLGGLAPGACLGDLCTASDSPLAYIFTRDAKTRDIQLIFPEAIPISAAIET